jgi:hypothetical protein
MPRKATTQASEGSESTGETSRTTQPTESHSRGRKVCPIPPDPLMGDKTPAIVEWYQENDPEEYKRRYKERYTHLNPRPTPPPASEAGKVRL